MTGKDKTGDQLVASIRKTKQAASTKKKTVARKTHQVFPAPLVGPP